MTYCNLSAIQYAYSHIPQCFNLTMFYSNIIGMCDYYRVAACDITGVWLPLILMLQSCKF